MVGRLGGRRVDGRPLAAMLVVTWCGIALLAVLGDDETGGGPRAPAPPPALDTGGRVAHESWTLSRVMEELPALGPVEIARRVGTDHDLALQLWATGDADARWLAAMIAAPDRASPAERVAFVEILQQNVHSAEGGAMEAVRRTLEAMCAGSASSGPTGAGQ